MNKPRIAVTMGDPAGIGPEVCLKMLGTPAVLERCTPIVFGDAAIAARVASVCGLPEPRRVLSRDQWEHAWGELHEPAVLDLATGGAGAVEPGRISAATGQSSFEYIDLAITEALAGRVDAVCTGPVHKEALHAAGHRYPGHTEIFADKTRASRSCMMLTCRELTCGFVTTHVGYRDVPALLSVEKILDVIQLCHDAMIRIRGHAPRMIACGLNPHAGENGLFGDREEQRLIIPALEAARAAGIRIEGPLPPDTAFLRERRAETDCYICMYHDQGHIPLKALAFELAVNITLGLPIIRTSVDHGTALDIAWQGKADVSSMIQAVGLAATLAGAGIPSGGAAT